MGFKPFTNSTEFPKNLDDLYAKIEAREYGYVWTPRDDVPQPFITWTMIRQIAAANQDQGQARVILPRDTMQAIVAPGGVVVSGDIDVSENDVFKALLRETVRASYLSCGDDDGKPVLYGSGVQAIIDALVE